MKAYPFLHKHPTSGQTEISEGMELRDYFAAKAMQSLMWNQDLDLNSKEDVVQAAFEYADEMIKQRNKKDVPNE